MSENVKTSDKYMKESRSLCSLHTTAVAGKKRFLSRIREDQYLKAGSISARELLEIHRPTEEPEGRHGANAARACDVLARLLNWNDTSQSQMDRNGYIKYARRSR